MARWERGITHALRALSPEQAFPMVMAYADVRQVTPWQWKLFLLQLRLSYPSIFDEKGWHVERCHGDHGFEIDVTPSTLVDEVLALCGAEGPHPHRPGFISRELRAQFRASSNVEFAGAHHKALKHLASVFEALARRVLRRNL